MKENIINAIYRRHKIDVSDPKFDIAIVNEMISDAIDAADSQVEKLKSECRRIKIQRNNYEQNLISARRQTSFWNSKYENLRLEMKKLKETVNSSGSSHCI